MCLPVAVTRQLVEPIKFDYIIAPLTSFQGSLFSLLSSLFPNIEDLLLSLLLRIPLFTFHGIFFNHGYPTPVFQCALDLGRRYLFRLRSPPSHRGRSPEVRRI
jgi:hypothetical protein